VTAPVQVPPPGTHIGRRALLGIAALAVTSAIVFGCGPYVELRELAGHAGLLDESPRRAAATTALLDALGDGGRSLYARFLLFDVAFLLAQATALMLVLAWAWPRAFGRRARWPAIAVLFAAAADLVEDALIAHLLAIHPEASAVAGAALPVATGSKLAAGAIGAATTLVAAVTAILRWPPRTAVTGPAAGCRASRAPGR
jgi:hypothetical protein